PPMARSRSAASSRRRRSAAVRARSTSSPVPSAGSLIAAMGCPNRKGWCVWTQVAKVFRCARMRWLVLSLLARRPGGGQRLPEVLLKHPRQAGGPGQPLVGPLLGRHIAEKQTQIAALHLLRRGTCGDCISDILFHL